MTPHLTHLSSLWARLRRRPTEPPKPTCPVCGRRLFPSGMCTGLANDGTHAVDGDGWPE